MSHRATVKPSFDLEAVQSAAFKRAFEAVTGVPFAPRTHDGYSSVQCVPVLGGLYRVEVSRLGYRAVYGGLGLQDLDGKPVWVYDDLAREVPALVEKIEGRYSAEVLCAEAEALGHDCSVAWDQDAAAWTVEVEVDGAVEMASHW